MLVQVIILSSVLVKLISGSCTWPGEFANTNWMDSSKGEITFTSDTLTGWTITITSLSGDQEYDTWRCHSTDLYESNNILVIITQNTFQPFGFQVYGYICLQFTEITQSSYRYYLNYAEEPSIDNERVAVDVDSSLNDWDLLCSLTDTYASNKPATSEYQVMINTDSFTSAKIDCPFVFLGSYDYTHTSSDGTVTCDSSSDTLSTCDDSTEMSLDYNTCPTKVAYSVADSVWCVDSVPSGGNHFVTVYNGYDTDADIDNTAVYRFSCLAISEDGTKASVAPNSCRKDQTPDAKPTHNGVDIGSTLTLSKTAETCPVLTAPDSGNVSYSTNGAVTIATYSCSSEYSLAGPESRTCLSNNSWTDEDPICTCILPTAPANGSLAVSIDETLTYSCDVGFVLNGDHTRSCQPNSNTWSGVEPTCVPTDSSTETGNGGSALLPVVIVLAILTVGLGIAFGLSAFYIWKMKKNAQGNKSNQNGAPSFLFPSSKAPMDHSQHIMDFRNTSSAMSAPMGYHPSPRMDPVTPRSIKSSTSTSSLHLSQLNLIREDTTSSVILDQNNPAPWIKRPKHEHGTSLNTGQFPPISESRTSLSTPKISDNSGQKHPRKKKRSFGNKMQRQNSIDTSEQRVPDKEQGTSRIVKAESFKSLSRPKVMVNRNASIPKSIGATSNGSLAVPKLNLAEQPARASTPVKHQIEVKDLDTCRTPRSNVFATVQ